MFNVSTLLLDDAFKPATPLTNGIISETLQQFASLSDILQGSVPTHFRCDRIFSDGIIANFLLIPTVNSFKNRLIYFLGHRVGCFNCARTILRCTSCTCVRFQFKVVGPSVPLSIYIASFSTRIIFS